jgi:hypothetical protein
MRMALLVVSMIVPGAIGLPSTAEALECNSYSSQPTVEKCFQLSRVSPRAKREGYSDAGIRRWCEQNQPTCYARAKNKKK